MSCCNCNSRPFKTTDTHCYADEAYDRRRCKKSCAQEACTCSTLCLCVDCDGSSSCHACCKRNSFWPSFSHPRTLSCAALYSAE